MVHTSLEISSTKILLGIFTHSYTIYRAIYICSESTGTRGSTLQTVKINAFVIYYFIQEEATEEKC